MGAFAQSNKNFKDSNDLLSLLISLGAQDRDRALQTLRENANLISLPFCRELVKNAHMTYASSDYSRAALVYELAREAAILSNNKNVLAIASLHRLGHCYAEMGDFARAIEQDLRSKQICEEINSTSDLVHILADLGDYCISISEYAAARKYSVQCLDLSSSLKEKGHPTGEWGLSASWTNLGRISLWEGDFKAALDFLQRTLEVSRRKAKINPGWVADDLINLQAVYAALGDYKQALKCLSEAIDIGRKLKDKDILQMGFRSLGVIYESQADYSAAIEWFTESLNLSREIGRKRDISIALYNIGIAQLEQLHLDDALKTFQEALRIAESAGAREVSLLVREGLGNVYRAKGEFPLALSCLEVASHLAQQLGDKNRLAETDWLKGETYYSMRDYLRSAELADKSYKLAEHIGRPKTILWSLTLRGKVALAQGKLDVARHALQHAIDTVESLLGRVAADEVGRAQFMEGTRIAPYHLMVELLLREHKEREALILAERTKARMLLDVLRGGKLDVASLMTSGEREHDREFSASLTSLNRQLYVERQRSQPDKQRLIDLGSRLEKTRLDYESFRNEIYAAHPELKSRNAETHNFDLDHLASLSSDNKTALVEFVVTDERTHVFVVTSGHRKNENSSGAIEVSAYTVSATKKELRNLVAKFGERLGNPNIREEAFSRQIYDLLLGPAKSLLADKTTVAIVPDDLLWDLPFQTLKQSEGRYLVENYAIFYAPSLSVLEEMVKKTGGSSVETGISPERSGTVSSKTVLALGNPLLSQQTLELATSVHRDEKLLPLPDAEREVKALPALYGTDVSKVYVGADASEGRAKSEMSNYRILHFATHGIIDGNSPMYSHIVLSVDDKDGDDGLLEAWEIMRLNLKADLAVLSACDTARGRTGAGEGVIGISWAFFVAGCPTTVVSQWKVDSASTAELMIEFHKNMVSKSQGQQTIWKKAEALRKAMLTVMKIPKYKDPFYWGSFVVVGAG